MRKNIFIDARMIGYGGVGRYVEELLYNLKEINNDKYNFNILILEHIDPLFQNRFFKWSTCRYRVYSLLEHIYFTKIWLSNFDLYFFPHFDTPLIKNNKESKVVVTVHDLLYLKPELKLGFFAEIYLKFMLFYLQKTADIVITDSIVSRNELSRWIDKEKIRIATPAKMSLATSNIENKENIILYCGNAKEHKNLDFMFDIFLVLKNRFRLVDKIVCTGFEFSDLSKDLITKYYEMILRGEIEIKGKVSDELLFEYYRKAKFVFLLSSQEGFGLSVVEGLGFGTPAIVLNDSRINTYIKRGIISVPAEVDSAALLIAKIWNDEITYKKLVVEGIDYVKEYQWRNTAFLVFKIFEEVLCQNG
ncbi:MAG: glycosyltransferase [Candidatus Hydrogenedentota bacterium]